MTRPAIVDRIRRTLAGVYQDHLKSYATKSYSQEGEDMILHRFFGHGAKGFYVDVGAHHPRRFSNTCFFYQRGWHGINIEPNTEGHALLERTRKRDINILRGISDIEGTLDYYMFEQPALNTLDSITAERQSSRSTLLETRRIKVSRLETILDKNITGNDRIDFINIDVEGHDLSVLKSNNWDKYRARLVIAEAVGKTIEEILDSELAAYMHEINYSLYAKTVNSIIFRESGST
jgi:FkbM family methyltransferase